MPSMFRKFSIALALLIPATVLALDFHDATPRYKDSPFNVAESAGISVLTNLGVVSGYPDGSFHPERTLNRAEFVKIALLTRPEELLNSFPIYSDAPQCFPDVSIKSWFHAVVCTAKAESIVYGYPDGKFHPERGVNYVEALKILANAFGYIPPLNDAPMNPWYAKYVRHAELHKILLPKKIPYDQLLTRGQAIQLATAFIADADGELQAYRSAERGENSSGYTSSVSSSASSPSSASSTSSSSSSFPVTHTPELSARSHFLILGERSATIASATFFPSQEPVYLRTVKVKLKDKVDAISTMYLLDATGRQLATMSLDPFDNSDKTWKATLESAAYELPKSQNTILAVELLLKGRNSGGSSERLIQVDTFNITVQGVWSTSQYDSAPIESIVYPKHQTTQARVTDASNALIGNDILSAGTNQILGAFTIKGTVVPGALLLVEHLEFQISKSASIVVNNWKLGTPDGPEQISCSINGSILNCLSIPPAIGDLTSGPRTFRVFGDVAIDQGSSNYFLQLTLNQPGLINDTAGAIRWTDGSGHFTWTELGSPIARGTLWK